MPPSMHRPRRSIKLPSILGSISAMTRSVSILTRALSAPDCARAIAGARRQPANSRRDSDIVVILEPSGAISLQALTRPKAFYAGAADDVNGRLARPIVIG